MEGAEDGAEEAVCDIVREDIFETVGSGGQAKACFRRLASGGLRWGGMSVGGPVSLTKFMAPAQFGTMKWLLIAGGIFLTPTPQTPKVEIPELINHTLLGETVPVKQVLTRNRWGTPMLPDDKGSYRLNQGIDEANITRSLILPPLTRVTVFRPNPR